MLSKMSTKSCLAVNNLLKAKLLPAPVCNSAEELCLPSMQGQRSVLCKISKPQWLLWGMCFAPWVWSDPPEATALHKFQQTLERWHTAVALSICRDSENTKGTNCQIRKVWNQSRAEMGDKNLRSVSRKVLTVLSSAIGKLTCNSFPQS